MASSQSFSVSLSTAGSNPNAPLDPPYQIVPMSPLPLRLCCALLAAASAHAANLTLRQDAAMHTISVYRANVPEPVLTQNARPDFRPYLHPIISPDGKSVLTEFSPEHHQHQTVRHQFVVYSGKFDDVALTDSWKAYTGETSDGVLWGLAKAEGRKAVFLTGEQAAAKMTVPAGFEAKLAAAEPMITQPMAFCWDDRGRLWVAENRDYENRKAGFANSGDSRLVILEDTNGDGTFDQRTVFLEGIPFPAAIAVGFDGLWLGAPTNCAAMPAVPRSMAVSPVTTRRRRYSPCAAPSRNFGRPLPAVACSLMPKA